MLRNAQELERKQVEEQRERDRQAIVRKIQQNGRERTEKIQQRKPPEDWLSKLPSLNPEEEGKKKKEKRGE